MESESWIFTGSFSIFCSKPVAITVTLIEDFSSSSIPIPSIIFTSFPAASWILLLILLSSDIFISSSPEPVTIFNKTCSAPKISLSLRRGESRAPSTASIALFSPLDSACPITAVPLFWSTLLASFKSILTRRCWEITSAIPLVAVFNTSLALANAWLNVKSPYTWISLSLFIINKVSTFFLSSINPCFAYFFLFPPSVENGFVTTPTVKIPFCFATSAITGAAPVPVPPPIPAVINNILVFASNSSLILSILSSAALFPISGFEPAPNPSVSSAPSWIFTGTLLASKACESVLQTTKSTPLIPLECI